MTKKTTSKKFKLCAQTNLHEQKIRMRDGTQVFVRKYQKVGANGVPIILSDGLGCDGFAWKYFIDYFHHQHPIIHWHYRGHGKSDVPRQLASVNVEVLSSDLQTILNRLEVDQAIFCGHSMGVQLTLEAFAAMPNRFAALVLICGGCKYPMQTWHAAFERDGNPTLLNKGMQRFFLPIASTMIRYPRLWQPLWSRLLPSDFSLQTALKFEVNKTRILPEDLMPYFEHLGRMQASVFAQMASSLAAHSAEHVLETINRPTLIVAGGRDTFCPPWLSQDMHNAIRESEMLYIADGTHCTPIEHPELINLRLEKFIRERVKPANLKPAHLLPIQVAS